MATNTQEARYEYPVLDSFIYEGTPYAKGDPLVLTKEAAEPLIKIKVIENKPNQVAKEGVK